MKAAVVTLSDKGFRNEREDKSGELVQMMLKEAGYEGEYIGIGSCILGYPKNGFPGPIERKPDYYKIIR